MRELSKVYFKNTLKICNVIKNILVETKLRKSSFPIQFQHSELTQIRKRKIISIANLFQNIGKILTNVSIMRARCGH